MQPWAARRKNPELLFHRALCQIGVQNNPNLLWARRQKHTCLNRNHWDLLAQSRTHHRAQHAQHGDTKHFCRAVLH